MRRRWPLHLWLAVGLLHGPVVVAAQTPLPRASLPPAISDPSAPANPSAGPVLDGQVAVSDYEWSLRELDGGTFRLERYRGKPLVLNVWATWCAPCVAELASLERLADSVEGQGVQFLIVSPEPAGRVRSFLRRHGYRIPAAVEDQRMPESFRLRALPTTYVLDRSGRIVLAHRGAADWDTDELRRLLRALAR